MELFMKNYWIKRKEEKWKKSFDDWIKRKKDREFKEWNKSFDERIIREMIEEEDKKFIDAISRAILDVYDTEGYYK
jgi:hypothetical protein